MDGTEKGMTMRLDDEYMIVKPCEARQLDMSALINIFLPKILICMNA